MSKNKDCIFCKIIKGEIPSYKVYEDENYLAFLDAFPPTEGYTLVVPKKHYRWVWDVKNVGEYFEVVSKIARHMQKVTGSDAVFSMVVGEEVPHAHVRVFRGNDNEFNEKFYKFLEDIRAPEMINSEEGKRLAEKFNLQ